MHHLFDLLDTTSSSPQNRRLIARIALNAMGYADTYPVDLSELRDLSVDQRALVRSFLCWADAHPRYIKDLSDWQDLTLWAQ